MFSNTNTKTKAELELDLVIAQAEKDDLEARNVMALSSSDNMIRTATTSKALLIARQAQSVSIAIKKISDIEAQISKLDSE